MKIKKLIRPVSELDIKKHWKYKNKIYVSCVCVTYNHEAYIRDAIDSVLAQKTEYRFEIVIYDDNSNDKTRDILQWYKKKYPSIINIILQDENQYSKGIKTGPLAMGFATGDYLALIEGDDFWIDYNKIQRQIKILESNKDINLCFSSAYGLYLDVKITNICEYSKNEFSIEDVILGGGSFMPTVSLVFRRDVYDNLPDWFYNSAPNGDYYFQMLGSINGAVYIEDKMCVYRMFALNSWSENRSKLSKKEIENYHKKHSYCMSEFLKMVNLLDAPINKLITSKLNLDMAFELANNKHIESSIILYRQNVDINKEINIKSVILSKLKFLIPLYVRLIPILGGYRMHRIAGIIRLLF